MARAKHTIGLDIGSRSVKMIQIKETKRGYQLQNFGMVPLPPEAIVDAALMNSGAVVDAIRDLMDKQRVKKGDTAIAVAGHSVIIKKIQLPLMSAEELEEQIQWEAEQYIPFDINDVYVDTQILSEETAEEGQMDVLLVAAKKEVVNDYTQVVQEAGLTPLIVDVGAFAVENAFEANYTVASEGAVGLVNIGAGSVNINVLSRGVSAFTRDISMGGNAYTEEIQKQLQVSFDEAEALKIGGEPGEESAVVPQEVDRIMYQVSEKLAAEVQRSLDFFSATQSQTQLRRVYLSGGTAKVPHLVRSISTQTGLEVEVVDPFRNLAVDEKHFDEEYLAYLQSVAPMATVCVGLGLRRMSEYK